MGFFHVSAFLLPRRSSVTPAQGPGLHSLKTSDAHKHSTQMLGANENLHLELKYYLTTELEL